MTPPVTWLYVPGDRPDRFDKARHSGADVVIIDLEDAVSHLRKDQARESAVHYLRDRELREPAEASAVPVHVRINPSGSAAGQADLKAIRRVEGIAGIRVPKVGSPADIDQVVAQVGDVPLVALLESAAGVEGAGAIAAHPNVTGLAIGEADLAAELGLRGDDALTWIRTRVVVAAAAHGLPPVAMSAYTHLTDVDGLVASCLQGRGLGMFGRAAIHPRQLPHIRRAFAPTPDDIEQARRVFEAVSRTDEAGALALEDGQFVDAPILARAQRTLDLARDLTDTDPTTAHT